MDIDEIRRVNLRAIEKEYGSLTAAADLVGMSTAQFSNLRDGAKDSKTGKPRGMRKETARRIEAAAGKPAGWLDQDHSAGPRSAWLALEGPHASGVITLPASLDTITAAIAALSPPDREQLAKALAILAVAPDSAEAKARVLVLLQPAHSVPGTESKAFQPPVPQSSTVNPTTA